VLKGKLIPLATGGFGILHGTRIPRDFFETTGFGETEQGGGVNPYETGSYDIALEDAGIENFNIMTYTSVIPAEARAISREEAQARFVHGSVLECIMAKMDGQQGDRISVGVARMQVRRKKDGQVIGGYAAEYEGHATKEDVHVILQRDLKCLFARRFKKTEYEMFDERYTIRVEEVKKPYATCLASICFVTYIMPVYDM